MDTILEQEESGDTILEQEGREVITLEQEEIRDTSLEHQEVRGITLAPVEWWTSVVVWPSRDVVLRDNSATPTISRCVRM